MGSHKFSGTQVKRRAVNSLPINSGLGKTVRRKMNILIGIMITKLVKATYYFIAVLTIYFAFQVS